MADKKKKRYYQSAKDRMDERRGEDKYLDKYRQNRKDRADESKAMKAFYKEERAEHRRRMHDGYYAGMDPRRRQELEDAGMIHEDHRAIANLPQQPIMREYPRYGNGYRGEYLDDRLSGVDYQIEEDDRQMMRRLQPEKV